MTGEKPLFVFPEQSCIELYSTFRHWAIMNNSLQSRRIGQAINKQNQCWYKVVQTINIEHELLNNQEDHD